MTSKKSPESEGPRRDRELIAEARRELEALAARAVEGTVEVGVPEKRSDAGSLPPSDSFTGYEILREIHRGGQGVVFQALQRSTQRKVAIKVLREGPFAGSADRARFEREVHILGKLNHPNIVGIHDTGEAAGHYYFVMDYISGQPLDVFMASGDRTVRSTLELFAKICEAVSSAQLRGVIHRDLKPSNIRVDSSGEPHVLDFGLAKVATGADSAMTMTGQFVGSLPWASPEQAEGSPDKIDLRTDVYSLGVVLFQMLTGKFPYEVVGNMRDVLDRILQSEPLRPSVLRREVDDEVSTIVLQCLSKERDRRYQTAGELGADVRAYLRGDPIAAKRDSIGYVLGKQLRRYRVPVAVAALFIVVLVGGLGVSLAALADARDARDAKGQALEKEREAFLSEKDQRARAEQEATNAREIASFYRELLELGNPLRGTALVRSGDGADFEAAVSEISMADMLLAGVSRVSDRFGDRPRLEAEVRDAIGSALGGLGYIAEAEAQLRLALEAHARAGAAEDVAAHRTRAALAQTLYLLARFRDAIPVGQTAWAGLKGHLGADDRETLRARGQLAMSLCTAGRISEGLGMAEEVHAAAKRLYKADETDYSRALWALCQGLACAGRPRDLEQAAHDLIQSVESRGRPHDPMLGFGHRYLGIAQRIRGRQEEAEGELRRSYEIIRQATGFHLMSGQAMIRLFRQLGRQEKLEEQVALCHEGIRICTERHGPQSFTTLGWKVYLAEVRHRQGRTDEAVGIATEVIAVSEQQLAEGHTFMHRKSRELTPEYRVLLTIGYPVLAGIRQSQNQLEDVLALQKRCLEITEAAWGRDHPTTIEARRELASSTLGAGRQEDARRLSAAVIESWERRRRLADATPWDLNALARELAWGVSPALRDPARALRVATRAAEESSFEDPIILMTLARVQEGTDNTSRAIDTWGRALTLVPTGDGAIRRRLVHELLGALLTMNRIEEAKRLLEKEERDLRSLFGDDDPQLGVRFDELAKVLVEHEHLDWATPLAEEAQRLRRESGEEHR